MAMFTFLRAIDLNPIEWSEAMRMTAEGSPHIWDILDSAFKAAQAVVVLLTPDDIAYLRPEYSVGEDDPDREPQGQARPNVLFEAGMALGRDARRTVLVELGKLRPFTDVAGRHAVRMDNTAQRRKDLAQRLRTAGCAVNLDGEDWLTAGESRRRRPVAASRLASGSPAPQPHAACGWTPGSTTGRMVVGWR